MHGYLTQVNRVHIRKVMHKNTKTTMHGLKSKVHTKKNAKLLHAWAHCQLKVCCYNDL